MVRIISFGTYCFLFYSLFLFETIQALSNSQAVHRELNSYNTNYNTTSIVKINDSSKNCDEWKRKAYSVKCYADGKSQSIVNLATYAAKALNGKMQWECQNTHAQLTIKAGKHSGAMSQGLMVAMVFADIGNGVEVVRFGYANNDFNRPDCYTYDSQDPDQEMSCQCMGHVLGLVLGM